MPASAPVIPHSFTTGGEDGYIRLHHMDNEYFSTKFF